MDLLGILKMTEDITALEFEAKTRRIHKQLLAKFLENGGTFQDQPPVEKQSETGQAKQPEEPPEEQAEEQPETKPEIKPETKAIAQEVRRKSLRERRKEATKEKKAKAVVPAKALRNGRLKLKLAKALDGSSPDLNVRVPDFTGRTQSVLLSNDHTAEPTPATKTHYPPKGASVADTSFIAQVPINTEEALEVPTLSFDLSRVLFNPGVYHLQDPRSRVYNFDPYLQNIVPVDEFNWDALNPYITSSEDSFLRDVALKQKKKYIGSSSSMTGAMSQFHFLLSAWRPLDFSRLSQKMGGLTSFTAITRAPASIFLRYRDGVYAIDADKEYDSPNVLMMHGKSMEKLLTLEKEEFEKYKKPKEGEEAPLVDCKPESYHYSTVESFLLRSQLDAYDSRLPGTGMFDLKTRAVAGIRMNLSNHESGMNYEIKDRFGLWESYEREYYDMIRAAFLKYSLQVRMGRMDGIFVAYHNIARIFGFQYISIDELDTALHGQADPTVGNREFRMSLKLMNELFDRATTRCPGQSLRFIFETLEPPKGKELAQVSMRVFAEVVTEDEIEKVQSVGKEKMEDYEESMAKGIDPRGVVRTAKENAIKEAYTTKATPSTLDSTTPDTSFLDRILGREITDFLTSKDKEEEAEPVQTEEPEFQRTVLCWTLRIYNEVNGSIVPRPENITAMDRWNVYYTIEEEFSKVHGMYNAVKNKRRSMFVFDEDEDREKNYFVRNIMRLNESGRVWRVEQNARDADKEKIVLYDATSTPKGT